MRPALPVVAALLLLATASSPAQAQWWGPGGGRPWDGGREGPGRFEIIDMTPRQRPFRAEPASVEPARFGGWDRPMAWTQEVRWPGCHGRRHPVAMSERRQLTMETVPERTDRRSWHPLSVARALPSTARSARVLPARHIAAAEVVSPARVRAPTFRPARHMQALPARADAAVAVMPVAATRPQVSRPVTPARPVPAAALLRHLPVARSLPLDRVVAPPLTPSHRAGSSQRDAEPAVLRSDPAAATAPEASAPQRAAPGGDVPVAPLD